MLWVSKLLLYIPRNMHTVLFVLCFVVVMQSFIMNSHEVFIHIHQGCFAGTGAIVRLPQCQWSKPVGYGKISQCITTTKHSKAKTVCIFLGIYCFPAPPTHFCFALRGNVLNRGQWTSDISMTKCKTVVTTMLTHWSDRSLVLSHRNRETCIRLGWPSDFLFSFIFILIVSSSVARFNLEKILYFSKIGQKLTETRHFTNSKLKPKFRRFAKRANFHFQPPLKSEKKPVMSDKSYWNYFHES